MRFLETSCRGVSARCTSSLWSLRGRLALRRGRLRRAVEAFEQAVGSRPDAFRPRLALADAYVRANDMWRAKRTLAQARETDPARFAGIVPVWTARGGDAAEAVRQVLVGSVIRPGWGKKVPVPAEVARPRVRRVHAAHLPYGDCRNLDEYARLRALPPISEAERETFDWDRALEDLLDEE